MIKSQGFVHLKSVNRELKAVEGVRVMVQTRKFRNCCTTFYMTTHFPVCGGHRHPNKKLNHSVLVRLSFGPFDLLISVVSASFTLQ